MFLLFITELFHFQGGCRQTGLYSLYVTTFDHVRDGTNACQLRKLRLHCLLLKGNVGVFILKISIPTGKQRKNVCFRIMRTLLILKFTTIHASKIRWKKESSRRLTKTLYAQSISTWRLADIKKIALFYQFRLSYTLFIFFWFL